TAVPTRPTSTCAGPRPASRPPGPRARPEHPGPRQTGAVTNLIAPATDHDSGDVFASEWEAWHRHHEEVMGDRHGFLAITNIHWLDGTPHRFDDVPGAWSTGPDGVTVDLDESEALTVEGEVRRGRHGFGVIAERASLYAYWDDNAVEVAKRGGYDLIRPRHP